MGRLIKFRAWHKKEMKMYSVWEMSAFVDGNFNHVNENLTVGLWHEENQRNKFDPDFIIETPKANVELMEYAGLKDRNSVEIYEGDIVKWTDEFAMLGEPKEFIRQIKWETYYGSGWNFGVSYKDGEKRWSYPAPSQEDIEVIGNIYQNPELLK